jgi:4-amino-4-deoxy-L-arabinose transferase-like glycosyltransferase
MAGLHALGGRRVALIGGALVATNYIFVMWNRAALMESTMTAFIVASWATYALAERRPIWGVAAGLAAVLAWFTKAAAAFFVAALVLDALVTLVTTRQAATDGQRQRRGAWLTLLGLALGGAVIAVWFVLPNWSEYYAYNVQMAVTRKPSYALRDLVDRASWLPIVHDFFTRMWLIVIGAACGIVAVVARWRSARPAERLLVLWILVGLLELTIHDSGNERRYVMFIPALIALSAWLVGSDRPWLSEALAQAPVRIRWVALPLVAFLGYLVFGSVVRLAFLSDVRAGSMSMTVRTSAALAALAGFVLLWKWAPVVGRLSRRQIPAWALMALIALSVGWNLVEYGQWARQADELNYRASVEIGRILSSGTLVQGKLANGLALENRIRPVFVGRGFGNYADRLTRDDVRYILTYVLPEVGYESQKGLIQEILDRYPNRRIVRTFDVDETTAVDRAELIDKLPHARD